MSSSARIEELQKKFDENPRRYFAPLANECRKAGELDAAIAICRAHLPQQPGHMSGHIVYGQALYESGEFGEARVVFEAALGLDPENLIALKHMGDIAAQAGSAAEARQWYVRVLETDPRNEEIQALVAGLGVDPAGSSAVAPELDGLPSMLDPELLAAAAEAADDGESRFGGPSDSLLAQPEFGEPDDASPPQGYNLEGFEATAFDTPADAGETSRRPDTDSIVELIEETLAAPTFDREPPDSSPLQDPPGSPESPDAFVTETMAELYLRQGYRAEALDVYRQLVAQHPDDAALRNRMERAEREQPTAPVSTVSGLPEALDPALVAAAAEGPSIDPEDFTVASFTAPAVAAAAAPAGGTIRDYLAALAQGRQPEVTGEVVSGGWDVRAEPVTAEPPLMPTPDAAEEIAEVYDLGDEVDSLGSMSPPADAPAPDASQVPAFDDGFGDLVTDAGDAPMVPPPAPAPAPVEASPARGAGLDALFGATVNDPDLMAASSLATAFASSPEPSESPREDEQAANPLSGRPARPGGNDLSLDSVFGSPRQAGATRNSGSFSFDQFFADGSAKPPREEASEPTAAGDDAEDLEQFNSWLHGLKEQ